MLSTWTFIHALVQDRNHNSRKGHGEFGDVNAFECQVKVIETLL